MSIMGRLAKANVFAAKRCKHKAKILLAFHCQIVQNHSMAWRWSGDRPDVAPRAVEREIPADQPKRPRRPYRLTVERIGNKTGLPKSDCERTAISMRQCGATYQQIGDAMGITRQRAQQLVRPGPMVRRAVAHEANWRCQDCGVDEHSGHIHHVDDSAADYNAMTNLAYLCIVCHRHRHTK